LVKGVEFERKQSIMGRTEEIAMATLEEAVLIAGVAGIGASLLAHHLEHKYSLFSEILCRRQKASSSGAEFFSPETQRRQKEADEESKKVMPVRDNEALLKNGRSVYRRKDR
jgi:hypothetical protein